MEKIEYCGFCEYNDGLSYTSYPSKVKCTLTDRFHLPSDECDCKELAQNGKSKMEEK